MRIASAEERIVIDFDVGRSFYFERETGRFTLVPWIRAVNEAATGAIAGTVTSGYTGSIQPIRNTNVTVYRGDATQASGTWYIVATGRTDDQGSYLITYLMPASYIVRVEQPEYPFLSSVSTPNVEVVRGQTTQHSVSLPESGTGEGASIAIQGDLVIDVGSYTVLRAAVRDAQGDVVANPSVGWWISDTGVASLTSDGGEYGTVTGKHLGSVSVMATVNGMTDSVTVQVQGTAAPVASVTVSPASLTIGVGDSAGVVSVLRDASGNTLSNRTITWRTSDASRVQMLGAWGSPAALRGVGVGSGVITATSEGKSGTATVTVSP